MWKLTASVSPKMAFRALGFRMISSSFIVFDLFDESIEVAAIEMQAPRQSNDT